MFVSHQFTRFRTPNGKVKTEGIAHFHMIYEYQCPEACKRNVGKAHAALTEIFIADHHSNRNIYREHFSHYK